MENKKPLCCIDIETTGLDINSDRIIEIYILKEYPDGTQDYYYSRFSNCGREIAPGAFEKHNISEADIIDSPTFSSKAAEIFDYIEGCDLCGYNLIKFDLPMLSNEFFRSNLIFSHRKFRIFDSLLIWKHYEGRTLGDAVKRYLKTDITNYHEAKADVIHTLKVFKEQLKVHTEDLDVLYKETSSVSKAIDLSGMFVFNDELQPIFGVGKYKGMEVKDILEQDPNYFKWLFEKSDWANETKLIAKKLYESRK